MRNAAVRVDSGQTGVAVPAADPVAIVDALLGVGDAELDYGRAKLAFDAIIDPSP